MQTFHFTAPRDLLDLPSGLQLSVLRGCPAHSILAGDEEPTVGADCVGVYCYGDIDGQHMIESEAVSGNINLISGRI